MGWPERLAAMASRLEAAERTVLYGAPTDRSPLPDASGPLPPECESQARELLLATEAMSQRVRIASTEIVARLDRVANAHLQRGSAPRPRVAYVDKRI